MAEANPNIVGLKDAVTEPGHTNQICRALEDQSFEVYSGFDDQFLYNLSAGGQGSIGGLANVVPDIWSDLIRSVNGGDYARAMRLTPLLHRLMPIYEMGSSCSLLFKKLMVHRGVDISPKAIFPFDESDSIIFDEGRELLDGVLRAYADMI